MVFQVVLPDDTIRLVRAENPNGQKKGQRSDNDRRPLLSKYDIHQNPNRR